MSDQMLDIDDKNKVVITPDDCGECEKFFDFFDIPKPEALQKAFDNFKKDPSYANQDELKFQLADVITTSEHPIFKDEVFEQIRPETATVRDEMSFERELEQHLSSHAE